MALVGCPHAYGELITVTFDGPLTWVDDELTGHFSIGNTFHVSMTYESTAPDQWPADPLRGYYLAVTSLNLSVGGYAASSTNGDFRVYDDDGGVRDAVFGHAYSHSGGTLVGADIDGMPLRDFLLQLDDRTMTAISSDALPTSFDPSLFDNNQLTLHWRTPMGWDDRVVATEFTSTSSFHPVPLPGAVLLASLGMATTGWICRRRRW